MVSCVEPGAVIDQFHPLRNDAASPTVFRLDPQGMLDLERSADAAGRRLVGVMHSHPESSPYPSPTDVNDASNYDPFGTLHHVIVSLRHAEPALRSFRIRDGEILEELVVVKEPEPTVHDQAGAVAAVARMPRPPT